MNQDQSCIVHIFLGKLADAESEVVEPIPGRRYSRIDPRVFAVVRWRQGSVTNGTGTETAGVAEYAQSER